MDVESIIHLITNRHKTLHKPGVGYIRICSKRFSLKKEINMTICLDLLWDVTYTILDIVPSELEQINSCKTETDLAKVIVSMSERRIGTEKEVKFSKVES